VDVETIVHVIEMAQQRRVSASGVDQVRFAMTSRSRYHAIRIQTWTEHRQ
jgi:hypothetical protein